MPLTKSTNKKFWPILCQANDNMPFIVGIFYGDSKPNNIEDYLSDLLQELGDMKVNGILIEEKHYSIKIKAFLCDAPARSFLKCTKGHTGYFACERCIVEGTYCNRQMFFDEIDCPNRDDALFAAMTYTNHRNNQRDHQLGYSPPLQINIPCMKGFPLDYMHLVFLGVMKRITKFMTEEPRICRLSSQQISRISGTLTELNGVLPSEFVRQPRSLVEWKCWRATEWRTFLLYTGPLVLKNVLSKPVYHHYLSLSVAISILLDKEEITKNEEVLYAKNLLRYLVATSSRHYTSKFLSYNVHSLIHLHEDVETFHRPLDSISCFPYENYLQVVKKLVRTSQNPVAQVVKRTYELESFNVSVMKKQLFTEIKCDRKEQWFLLENSNYACVKEIRDNDQFLCNVYNRDTLDSFYIIPCDSKRLNIVYIKDNSVRYVRNLIEKNSFKRKVICMPYKAAFVRFPSLHDCTWQ